MKLPFPLQETEKVLVMCRRHWIYLYPRLVLQVLIAVLPVLALYLVLRWADALDGLAAKVAVVVAVVWLAVWAVKIILVKYQYDNDLWTITDRGSSIRIVPTRSASRSRARTLSTSSTQP